MTTMENVVYARTIVPENEEGSEGAKIYLTEEANGFALFYTEPKQTYLLAFHMSRDRDRSIEQAVRFTALPDRIKSLALAVL